MTTQQAYGRPLSVAAKPYEAEVATTQTLLAALSRGAIRTAVASWLPASNGRKRDGIDPKWSSGTRPSSPAVSENASV